MHMQIADGKQRSVDMWAIAHAAVHPGCGVVGHTVVRTQAEHEGRKRFLIAAGTDSRALKK
jgi:hypothetical protein